MSRIFVITVLSFYFDFELHMLVFDDILSLFSTWRLCSRDAKTKIRQRDWLKLVGEKIRREQVGTVPTFLSVRANKFAKWKIGFRGGGGVYY